MTTILVLSLVGIVAIIAELILPGGIIGLIGGVCLIAAVIMTFVEFGPVAGVIALAALLVLGFMTLSLWMKHFHKLPVTRKFVLNEASGKTSDKADLASLLGKTGKTVTDLTPSGFALIDEQKLDVMTATASIPKGTMVRGDTITGPTIYVSSLDE